MQHLPSEARCRSLIFTSSVRSNANRSGMHLPCDDLRKDRLSAPVAADEVDLARIRRPSKLIHPVDRTSAARSLIVFCLPVVQHQPELIALISRARLAPPRQILSVGRIGGVEIAARATCSPSPASPRDRSGRACRFARWWRWPEQGRILGEGQLFRIGREVAAAARPLQRKRRNVVRVAGVQIAHRAGLNRNQKQMRPLVAGEVVPVAIEQVGKDLRLDLARGQRRIADPCCTCSRYRSPPW